MEHLVDDERVGPRVVVGDGRDLGAELERDGAQVMHGVTFVDDLAHAHLLRVVPPRVSKADADDPCALVHQPPDGREHFLWFHWRGLSTGVVYDSADAGDHLRPDESLRYHTGRPAAIQVILGSRAHEQPRLRATPLHDDVRADGRRQPEHGRLAQQSGGVRAERRRSPSDALQHARRNVVRSRGHLRGAVGLPVREEAVGERPTDVEVDGVHQSCSPQNGLS